MIGITNAVDVMAPMGSNTTSGGWQSVNEVYAQGLVTSDRNNGRPVARLASKVPSLEDGSVEILADGRMKTVYPLRTDVTWHDGVRFTAKDMLFSVELGLDRNLPRLNLEVLSQVESAEAPDDSTFILYWKAPYYQADSVGLRGLWPHPRHLLEESYRTLDRLAFQNQPYWTSEHIHLGPFRVVEFRPGEEIAFAAYDKYFLGRPKVDRVIVRQFNDDNVLYSALLAGGVDMLMDNSLGANQSFELKESWDRSGAGTVFIGTGTTRFVSPQFDPQYLQERASLDPRVRHALTYAMDRVAVTELMQGGHGELVANSLLPPGDRLHDAVKDGFAQFRHDPVRASALLAQAGWTMGPDGVLVEAGGRRFVTALWTTQGSEGEIAAIADFWKRVGVMAEQYEIPGARVRDREYRSKYPGFETSATGSGDAILARVDPSQSAVAPNWAGSNRGHYINPQLNTLIDRYQTSISERDQSTAIKAISDVLVEDMPLMLLYYNATRPAVRKGIKAFDDFAGGAEGARIYGTFTRNAHEWDVL